MTPHRQTLRAIGNTFVALLVGIAVVLLVTDVSRQGDVLDAIRASQQDRAPIIDSTHSAAQSSERALRLIESCLVPGRSCNRRSARNQRDVLRQVLDGSLYVAICARDPQVTTVAELRVCAHRQAAADTGH